MNIKEKLLISATEAAKLLSISKTTFYSLYSAGRIGPMKKKLCGRCLFDRKELESWVAAGMPNRDNWMERGQVC